MARGRKKKHEEESEPMRIVSKETMNGILSVFSALFAIFLLLSAFGLSGTAGEVIHRWLSTLFGVAFYFMPLIFIMLSASLIRDRERSVAMPHIIGSTLLFISLLGLIDLTTSSGGLLGGFVSRPLNAVFGIYFSAIMLSALAVIAILITFDVPLKIDFSALLRRLLGKAPLNQEEGATSAEEDAINRAVEKVEKSPAYMQAKEPVVSNGAAPKQMKSDEDFMPTAMRRSGKKWNPPPLSLLEGDRGKPGVGDIKANANLIKRTLQNFGIVVEMDEISIGPSVTRYAMKPAEGVKLAKIVGLQPNLELALAAHPVRIEAPIPGKSLVGIEVPNTQKATIGLGSLVSDDEYTKNGAPLFAGLGRDISGSSRFANIAKMPHLLVAGATGSGKSVTIHAIITSLLYRNAPDQLKFIMIDPKRVELTLYNKIPHLLTPVITDPKKSILALKWAGKEMQRRYDILEKASVRDISSYHQNIKDGEPMPYIVVIIDELADLMQAFPRELEAAIVRLAQMSRAVGIHLILSTQRPSVNVITGLIKANIPARIALQVASQIDSRTIIDMAGAEKLLGAGDMLFLSSEMNKPVRIQSAFISEKEVKDVVQHLAEAYADELQDEINLSGDAAAANPNAIFSASLEDDGGEEDELYEDARETVMQAGKASTSFLQRKLGIGYARAARLMDILEERGIIGPGNGAKPREVIGASGGAGDEFGGENEFNEEAR